MAILRHAREEKGGGGLETPCAQRLYPHMHHRTRQSGGGIGLQWHDGVAMNCHVDSLSVGVTTSPFARQRRHGPDAC